MEKSLITPPASYKVEGVGEDMLPDNVHLDVMDGFDSSDMIKKLLLL
jgi:hypothetical protein